MFFHAYACLHESPADGFPAKQLTEWLQWLHQAATMICFLAVRRFETEQLPFQDRFACLCIMSLRVAAGHNSAIEADKFQ
jgi:hypothetical protein